MMPLRRLFGLTLLFLFFEAVVAIVTTILYPDTSVFLACAAMTGLAIVVWMAFVGMSRFLMRPRGAPAPMVPAPSAKPVPPQPAKSDNELATLLQEANGRLANAPGGAGANSKPVLPSLPLYLVIGPENAGKTSAVSACGLNPRLLAGESFRESAVVPTRLCNFWFANGAVFADIAGRIFSDDPERWQNILRTLSGRRKRSWLVRLWRGDAPAHNLRGVVLLLEASLFRAGADPQKLAALARKFQDRLQAAGSAFGADFPVYVIFSKADSIPYFAEFFARLSEAEDQRILGATLPLEAAPAGEVYVEAETHRLTGFFNRLYASLAAKRLLLLAREDTSAAKAPIYEFPREVKRCRGEIVRFLVDLFRPNPLAPSPRLRGFYFSGIRRVSRTAALDEAPGEFSVARSGADATVFFGARGPSPSIVTRSGPRTGSPNETVPRWAFLTALFNSVILADVSAAPKPVRPGRFEIQRNVVLVAAAAVLLVLSLTFARSWAGNRALLRESAATLERVSRTGHEEGSMETLADLEAIRNPQLALLTSYSRQGVPWSLRWGLYSGDRALASLHRVYFQRFRKLFLNPMLVTMTSHFAQLSPGAPNQSYGDVYDQLKAYRMVTSGACRPDKAALDRILPAVWLQGRSVEPDVQALANRQVQFYTAELAVENPYQISEDTAARTQAQEYLASFKGPEKLLRGLLDQVNGEKPGIDLGTFAPNYAQVLTGPGRVEASFTRDGYAIVEQRLSDKNFASAGDTCVVGGSGAGALLGSMTSGPELQDLYARQYLRRWKDFLEAQAIAPFRNADAAEKLGILADNNRSPLLGLVYMASANTSFPAGAKSVAERVTAQFTGIQKLLGRAKKAEKQAQEAATGQPAPPLATTADIARAFQPAQFTVLPGNQGTWLNEANRGYMTSLAELGDAFRPLTPRAGFTPDPQLYDQARKAVDKAWAAARQMEQGFNNTPEGIDLDLKTLIDAPIKNAEALLPRDSTQPLIAQANGAAQAFCAKYAKLYRKFPFNPDAPEEVSLDELARFFAPMTGELFQLQMQAPFDKLLLKQGKQWIQNPAVAAPRLTSAFLQTFNTLAQFSDALFPDGAPQPHLEYTVSLNSTAPVPHFDLEVDGRTLSYTGLPMPPVKLSWPAATPALSGAKLTVKYSEGLLPNEFHGTWGLFRLLASADDHDANGFVFSHGRVGRGGGSPLQDAKGQPVSLHVLVDSPAGAIFDRSYFARLHCLPRAAQ